MGKLFPKRYAIKLAQRGDQERAIQFVAVNGERGILPEQLALILFWSFRGLPWG